ncbi:MAG TPA: isochorismatase family cysteine hydrolase, partial [Nocardioides sp.]
VVEVRTEHRTDPSTWALNMREDDCPVMIVGTDDVRPVAELDAVRPVDDPTWRVLRKTRDSAFVGTGLADLLHRSGVERIALAGISTESCVATTAIDAYAHDLRVVLVADAVLTPDPGRHRAVLEHLAELYRQPAVTLDDLALGPPRLVLPGTAGAT